MHAQFDINSGMDGSHGLMGDFNVKRKYIGVINFFYLMGNVKYSKPQQRPYRGDYLPIYGLCWKRH